MSHFNEMMRSEWAKDFSKSFNSFTNNVGNFVDSMSDDTPGSTTTAFANLYKGPGAPWAWTATALAMSNAFNSPSGGGQTSRGWSVSGIVPWLALGALGFGAYKAWPMIKNLLAAEKNTRGWRAYQADPDNPDNEKKAIDDTVRLRRNKQEAQKTADGINAHATLTGDHSSKAGFYGQINTSPDEYMVNNGLKASVGARKALGGWSGIVDSFWRTSPKLRSHSSFIDMYDSYIQEPKTKQLAKSVGVSDQDYAKMVAADNTGTINGSYPTINLTVKNQTVGGGDDRHNREVGWLNDLRAKGSITQEAYKKQLQQIRSRYAERSARLNEQQRVKGRWLAGQAPREVAMHPVLSRIYAGWTKTSPRTVATKKAPQVVNKPRQATYNGPHTVVDGQLKVKNSSDPYWKTHKLSVNN